MKAKKAERVSEKEDVLLDKVVVLTGVSSGFGLGGAVAFARAGAKIVLAARRGEVLQEVVETCEAEGADTIAVEMNVSDELEISELAQTALSRFGRIDLWINNAGAGAIGRFDVIPLEDHVQVIETTLLGTLYGSWVALRQFHHQGEGILINVASIAGKVAAPFYASYAAAKHGVVGLSAALRLELEQEPEQNRGIRVCTLLPDAHDTPFFQHAANYSGHEVEPPPPVHDPKEVVEAMLQLAREPRDEMVVGSAGKIATAARRVSPALAESMLARSHAKQMETPPAEDTDGSFIEPSPVGTRVRGGWSEESRSQNARAARSEDDPDELPGV
jgi:short-subunit dehydrogenase